MNESAATTAHLAAPFGGLSVTARGGFLVSIDFIPAPSAESVPSDPLLQEAARQLHAYFADPRTAFSLPWHREDTPFRHRVWQAIVQIPPGQALSYGELARIVGTSARAIGGACRANTLPILIPCHRILSTSGGLCGYCGGADGPLLDIKRWLLRHEGYEFS